MNTRFFNLIFLLGTIVAAAVIAQARPDGPITVLMPENGQPAKNSLACPTNAGTNSGAASNLPGDSDQAAPQAPPASNNIQWPAERLVESENLRVFHTPNFLLRIRQDPDQQILFLYGSFKASDMAEVQRSASALVPGKNVTVSVKFGGGIYGVTQQLITQIRDACKVEQGCHIRTELPSGQMCASFCIVLFMIGEDRVAWSDSKFGFHAATQNGCVMPGQAETAYRVAGVSGTWLDQNAGFFVEKDVTFLGPTQIMNSNIVTRILRKDSQPIP